MQDYGERKKNGVWHFRTTRHGLHRPMTQKRLTDKIDEMQEEIDCLKIEKRILKKKLEKFKL